jgi:hypothetical protein
MCSFDLKPIADEKEQLDYRVKERELFPSKKSWQNTPLSHQFSENRSLLFESVSDYKIFL